MAAREYMIEFVITLCVLIIFVVVLVLQIISERALMVRV